MPLPAFAALCIAAALISLFASFVLIARRSPAGPRDVSRDPPPPPPAVGSAVAVQIVSRRARCACAHAQQDHRESCMCDPCACARFVHAGGLVGEWVEAPASAAASTSGTLVARRPARQS